MENKNIHYSRTILQSEIPAYQTSILSLKNVKSNLIELKKPLEKICEDAGGILLSDVLDLQQAHSYSEYLVGHHYVEHHVTLNTKKIRTEITVLQESMGDFAPETVELIEKLSNVYQNTQLLDSRRWGTRK